MDDYGAAAEARYHERVDPIVTDAIGRAIIEGLAFAADDLEDMCTEEETRDALPTLRRAYIETRLVGLRGIVEGIEVPAVTNIRGNAHREVRLPGVVVTQSLAAANGPDGHIRGALFRESLGERSQITIEEVLSGGSPERAEEDLWACFVYAPLDDRPDLPAFLRVAFPRSDGHWEHSIDLMALIPTLQGYPASDVLLALRRERRRSAA